MTGEESRNKRIVYMASIVVALVGLLITIIAAHSLFPPLMFYSIVTVLVVLIVIVNGYGIFGQQLIEAIKKKAIAKKHHVLTREYYKKFKKLVDRFRELMCEDHSGTMPAILKCVTNSNHKYVNILPFPQNFTDSIEACYEAIGNLPVTKNNFLIFVQLFESIMNLCNNYLICKPIEEIRKKGVDEIQEHIIEEYEKYKMLYDRFLCDYKDFAKDMNKAFGEIVASAYFEVPKGLRK